MFEKLLSLLLHAKGGAVATVLVLLFTVKGLDLRVHRRG